MPSSSQMSRGYTPAGRHGAGKRPQKLIEVFEWLFEWLNSQARQDGASRAPANTANTAAEAASAPVMEERRPGKTLANDGTKRRPPRCA